MASSEPSVGLTVLLTYDEPECGGAADALVQMLEAEVNSRADSGECVARISVESFPITEGEERHDQIVATSLEALTTRPGKEATSTSAERSSPPCSLPPQVMVVCFLRDHAPEAYLSVKEVCARYKENVWEAHVLTHLANYDDVSLVLRNLIRIVFHYLAMIKKKEERAN